MSRNGHYFGKGEDDAIRSGQGRTSAELDRAAADQAYEESQRRVSQSTRDLAARLTRERDAELPSWATAPDPEKGTTFALAPDPRTKDGFRLTVTWDGWKATGSLWRWTYSRDEKPWRLIPDSSEGFASPGESATYKEAMSRLVNWLKHEIARAKDEAETKDIREKALKAAEDKLTQDEYDMIRSDILARYRA